MSGSPPPLEFGAAVIVEDERKAAVPVTRWRFVRWPGAAAFTRLSRRRFEAIRDGNELRAEYAGQSAQCVDVLIEMKSGQPARVLASYWTRWSFDACGRLHPAPAPSGRPAVGREGNTPMPADAAAMKRSARQVPTDANTFWVPTDAELAQVTEMVWHDRNATLGPSGRSSVLPRTLRVGLAPLVASLAAKGCRGSAILVRAGHRIPRLSRRSGRA